MRHILTLIVEDGIATLIHPHAPRGMPLAEGFGATNDEAVADLIAKVTFDGKGA